MTKRIPWPGEAATEYWQLRDTTDKLKKLLVLFIDFGVARQNTSLIERIIPRAESEAREITGRAAARIR